ncbi:MAG: T9SS type A sorting domain-containing protein [Chlorobi bacterium]|nr:T9SS type A sorting domain-containing protein [Chlorobiota bacterium]
MKKIDFIKRVLLAVLLIAGSQIANAQADSLRAYYDGESVNPVNDMSGNGFVLDRVADNLQSVPSGISLGNYLDLPAAASDDYSCLTRGAGGDLGVTNEFTIMAFIYDSGDRSAGVFNYAGFSLNTSENGDGTTKYQCAMRIDDDSETDIWFEAPDDASVNNGEWHHLAFTYDGNNVKIYIDGSLKVDSVYGSHTINWDKNAGRISIGYGYTGIAAVFTGKVDEAKIFNKALSQEQIMEEALVANAGEDQYVGLGDAVTLDGSKSIGAISSYNWELDGQSVGTTATISTDTLSAGEHVFTLTVSDGTNSSSDEVVVKVASVVAVAGDDQTVDEGELVTLDASASVGTNLSYTWTLDGVTVGTTVQISTDTLSIGEHTFTLEVTDGVETSTDEVVVTVNAVPVVAAAGADQAVVEGFMLTLNGGGSTGYGLTYLWRLNETDIGTTPVIMTDTLSIGKHVFALAVTDAHGVTAADTVNVYVEGTESLIDFETMYTNSDTSFVDLKNGAEYLVFDTSNGTDKTNGDRLPEEGAVPTLVEGVKGMAMEFDGSNDWVDLQYAYSRGGFNAKSEDYSTSIWFNAAITSRNPPKSPAMVIFDAPGVGLMLWDDTLCIAAYMRDRDDKEAPVGSAKVMIPYTTTDTWTHVALVFDGAATTTKDSSLFKVYINGDLVETDTIPVPNFYADWYDWTIVGSHTGYAALSSVYPETMIPYAQEGDMDSYFSGIIDELYTERAAWTDQDVQDLYNDGTTFVFENNRPETINVYPNPSRGTLRIAGLLGTGQVEIMNMSGEVIKQMEVASSEMINISDLNSGIYIFRVKTADKTYVSKVILTK